MTERPHMKPLPEFESAVIAAMIIDRASTDEITSRLSATDFGDDRMREMYITLLDMHEANIPTDCTKTLYRVLQQSGGLERIGGPQVITQLTGEISDLEHASHYAHRVRADATDRRLKKLLRDAADMTVRREPSDRIMDYIDSQMVILRQSSEGYRSSSHIADATTRLCDAIDAAQEKGTQRGLRTGLRCFDAINGGLQNGTLNIIAARPSNGKSVLGLQFAESIGQGFEYSTCNGKRYYTATQSPVPTLFVSLEMTEEELAMRSLAAAAKVDGRRINNYKVTAEQRARLREAAADMASSKLYIEEPYRATVSSIRATARIHQRQHGLGCLVIDYLQMLDSEKSDKHEKETYRIGDICRRLKILAKEMGIPVIVLCQLNRDAENKMPTLAQLADSGKIEQHGDTITAIHRMRDNEPDATLKILKWRNGQTPEVKVTFDRCHVRFVDPSDTQPSHPNANRAIV